ncbi:MAG: hypothetical protein A3G59_01235 [Candidatus Taylorbacteria bacterium RIFCSPLOWO2_12_FULL_47_20]|uniref:Uncharacterized protein n=2 Tax=Candidatus Tayloriibacteriota TaxID=1817919 RepID=A0A1G2P7T7_9BACT|nr:MAG: hypothetical protein A3H68_02465 [Candidatus Taylorbacteria bacterium RIFCSPLOWO2_02_FULL_46_40]OHA43682.1 MAG: hypothetical protein A3G59_01235 [Candidatus Taylorbacteria bacterium RIFCSPLOWO2_12_FULL_47_20]
MNTVELVRKVLDNGQHLELAKRCLISPCTVRQWKRTGKIKPKGAILIKLQEFLIEQGQLPNDVKILDYPLTDMRVLVAKTKIADQKTLANKVGYKDAPDLYVVLRGKHPPSASCREKMVRLVSSRKKGALNEANASGIQKRASAGGNDLVMSTLKGLAETALPLAQLAVSDKITADERAKFRTSFKDDGLHLFADCVQALLSEENRKQINASYVNAGKQFNNGKEKE